MTSLSDREREAYENRLLEVEQTEDDAAEDGSRKFLAIVVLAVVVAIGLAVLLSL